MIYKQHIVDDIGGCKYVQTTLSMVLHLRISDKLRYTSTSSGQRYLCGVKRGAVVYLPRRTTYTDPDLAFSGAELDLVSFSRKLRMSDISS